MESVNDAILAERANGELLGPLIEKYGAPAVVDALGVAHLANTLLLDGPSPSESSDPDEDAELWHD